MADKAISELVAAPSVTPDSLFVLQQDGTAKKLTAQVLENWLLSFAGGHGGIQSWVPLKKEGLVTTYRITLADQTHIDIDVVDGRGIESVKPTSTVGLVVTYTITYNDGNTDTITVTNGEKGDKGDNANVWIRYASQKPTASSHSFGEVADAWIGICSNHLETAPTDWQQYQWYQWKGEKGDTGDPAVRERVTTEYQVGDAVNIVPSGQWLSSIPNVPQGKYLWIRKTTVWNRGDTDVDYSVSRMGIDGSGAVSTVAGVSPDADGNVPLTAADVKALPVTGGTMEGPINMNGQPLSGLNAPTKDDEAATKGYVDGLEPDLTGYATETYVKNAVRTAAPRNLLDNSNFTNPVNQRGVTSFENAYGIDRWTSQGGVSTVNSESITVTNIMDQRLEPERVRNCIHTLAAMKSDGTVVLYCRNPHDRFADSGRLGLGYYPQDNVVIARLLSGEYKWAALYEGEYTSETLPAYQPKGYGMEMAECLRYFQRHLPNANLPMVATNSYRCLVGFSCPMRIVPTIETVSAAANAIFTYVTKTSVVFSASGESYVTSFNASADL